MPADRRGRGPVGRWRRLVPHDGGNQPRTLPVHVQRDGAELPHRHDILHRELPEPLAMRTLDDWPGPRWAAIAASYGRCHRPGGCSRSPRVRAAEKRHVPAAQILEAKNPAELPGVMRHDTEPSVSRATADARDP